MSRMLMRLAVGLLVGAVLLSVGLAEAQPPAGSGHDAHQRKLENELAALLNSSYRYVARHHPQCRIRFPSAGTPRSLHGAPDPALLATLAILRRPAVRGDTLPSSLLPRGAFISGIYVDYVRIAHAVDGTTFYLFPVRQSAIRLAPQVCVTYGHDRLLELLRGKPNDLRRLTLKADARQNRQSNPRGGIPARDGLFVFSRDGGGGGGASATLLRRSGSFMTSSRNNGPAEVTGVVPDGVTSITAIYDRAVSRGAYNTPKIYPTRIVRVERVHDNVIDFTVPRPAPDAFPSRMTWHLTNGSTRIVTQPQG